VEVLIHSFLTSALVRDERQVSRPGRFSPQRAEQEVGWIPYRTGRFQGETSMLPPPRETTLNPRSFSSWPSYPGSTWKPYFRFELFWNSIQHRIVVRYRYFETTCRSHIQGPSRSLTTTDGTDMLSRNVVRKLPFSVYVIQTNLMHYLSSAYFVNQSLYFSGIFTANLQEVFTIYTTNGTCCMFTVYLLMMGYKYARNMWKVTEEINWG